MSTLRINDHTAFPPTFLNAYIFNELTQYVDKNDEPLMPTGSFQPFFPAQAPNNIEGVYNDAPFIRNNPDATVIIFDRLTRFRPTTFYRHKREQVIYFIYSPNVTKLLDTVRVITECLDREDAAAQDLNSWIALNDINDEDGNPIPKNVFFHNIKVYQADETRDILELSSARTLNLNKLIIEYDYHTQDVAGSTQRYT